VRVEKALAALDAALAAVPGSQERPGQRAMVSAVAQALGLGRAPARAGRHRHRQVARLPVPALASGKRVVVATATKGPAGPARRQGPPAADPRARAGARAHADVRPGPRAAATTSASSRPAAAPGAARTSPDSLFDGPASSLGTQVVRLREWGEDTTTGDRDEVPFPVTDRAWRQVSVSARECLGSKCPSRVDCFAEKAREAAKEADVVVANHTLLALDVFTGVSVLPERDAVVLDEAHEFVSSVTDALSHELSNGDVRRAVAGATELVATTTQERLEQARDGLEGVLGTLQPGWIQASTATRSTRSRCSAGRRSRRATRSPATPGTPRATSSSWRGASGPRRR
jgi:ATP-dependent DNA helicase DinG